jgi:glutathione synthase/RimK-type ligase-like ATP-grasp enzyme
MSKPLTIALASCHGLRPEEVDDDHLIEALRDRGYTALSLAWDDSKASWSDFAACLPRTTWDYTARLPEFRAWIDTTAAATRLFNPPDILHPNLDKSYLRDLGAAGLPLIPTEWIESDDETADLRAILRARGWSRAFLKPAVGAGSELTVRIDAEADAATFAAAQQTLRAAQKRGPVLLQPYLESVESRGELSVIVIDGVATHAVRKIPVPGDYRVQDDFGAHDEALALTEELEGFAERAILAAGAGEALYARVDLLEYAPGDMRLVELELVEPSLFFRHAPEAAHRLAEALSRRLEVTS